MMKDMNDWIFIKTELVQQNNDVAKSQCNKELNDSLNLRIEEIKAAIKPLHFGAISCNAEREFFWLVQWRGEPFKLTQQEFVEGGTVLMPVGTWVCEATWYSRINQAPGWYERSSNFETNLYRLQLVATPNITVESFNTATGNVPPATARKEYNEKTARGALKYIPKNELTIINRDIFRLDKLELLPLNDDMNGTEDDGTSEDENIESDDDVPKEVGSEDDDNDDSDEDED